MKPKHRKMGKESKTERKWLNKREMAKREMDGEGDEEIGRECERLGQQE